MSNTTFVSVGTSLYTTGTQSDTSNVTPTGGNDLILLVLTFTASAALSATGVTTNGGGTVIADVPFAVNATNNIGFGAYRIHDAAATAQNLVANFTGNVECYSWIVQVNNVGQFDTASPAALSGTTAAFNTNTFTPSQSGAMILCVAGNTHGVTATWTSPFAAISGARTGGPSTAGAYYDQATAASLNAAGTWSAADPWTAFAVSYVPVNTSPSITSVNGGSAIPEGSMTVPLVGANFGTGMTLAATQPNGVSVPQSTVTAQSGSISTVGITTQPTGTLTNGYYYGVALTPDSTSGTAAKADITVAGGAVTQVIFTGPTDDPGYNYAVNDTLFIPLAAIPGATANGVVTVTAINSTTRATFTVVMEPATGDQLAYTDSTFVTNLTATVGSLSSAPFPVTVAPPTTGIPFQTLGSLNPTAPNRITAEPDLVTGDQLEFAGNSSGTTAPAAGTVIHSDGTFEATQPFWVRAYITADFAWTGWVQQVTTGLDPSQGFFGGGM